MTITREEILEDIADDQKTLEDIADNTILLEVLQKKIALSRLALKGLAAEGLVEALAYYADTSSLDKTVDPNGILSKFLNDYGTIAVKALARFEAECGKDL